MQIATSDSNPAGKLKHSSLSITSFIFLMLAVIPVLINATTGGLLDRLIESTHSAILNLVSFFSIYVFLLCAIILAIIDLTRPNRLKVITLITLIVSLLFFVIITFAFVVLLLAGRI